MLEMAQVVEVHPESNSVDVVMMRTGRRIPGCQVLAPSAGTTFGLSGLTMPDITGDKYEAIRSGTQDIYALVAIVGTVPLVLGFLYPQVSEMLFEERDREIDRHVSDVYKTINKDGDFEFYHPSGAFVRIAVDTDHEDLTGKDYDKKWKISRNTDKLVDMRVEITNANGFQSSLLMTKDGNVELTTTSDVIVTAGANVSVNAQGNVVVSAAGDASVSADGNITVEAGGDIGLSAGGELNVSASSMNVAADVAISGGSVTHDGKDIGKSHKHAGVTAGGAQTGVPV